MGCVCCSLSSFISIVLDSFERATLCTVCAALTCCLLFTLIFMLVLGVGIGYHYCFVQHSVEAMGKAAKAAGAGRSGPARSGPVMRSLDRENKRGKSPGFSNQYRDRRAMDDVPPLSNNNTINELNSLNVTNATNEETKSANIDPDDNIFYKKIAKMSRLFM